MSELKKRNLKYELIPINKFDSIKKINDSYLAIKDGKISLSSNFSNWCMHVPHSDNTILKATVLYDNFICIGHNLDKYISINSKSSSIIFHDLLANNYIYTDLVAGNSHIVIYNGYSVRIIFVDSDMKPMMERCLEIGDIIKDDYPIGKIHYFCTNSGSKSFIIFHKDIGVISTLNSNISGDFTTLQVIDDITTKWNWDDIVTYNDDIVCLNSEKNKLLVLNIGTRIARLVSIPCNNYRYEWTKLSVYNNFLSISSTTDDTHSLLTYNLFDFYKVYPFKDAKKLIMNDNYGNAISVIGSEESEIKSVCKDTDISSITMKELNSI